MNTYKFKFDLSARLELLLAIVMIVVIVYIIITKDQSGIDLIITVLSVVPVILHLLNDFTSRIVITEEGLNFRSLLLPWLNYKFTWQEANQIWWYKGFWQSTCYVRIGEYRLHQIKIKRWQHTRNFIPLLKSMSTYIPIEQLSKEEHQEKMREFQHSSIGRQYTLGQKHKKLLFVLLGAFVLAIIGIFGLGFWFEVGTVITWWHMLIVAAIAMIVVARYMFKHKIVMSYAVTISILYGVVFGMLSIPMFKVMTIAFGSDTEIRYELVESTERKQVWNSLDESYEKIWYGTYNSGEQFYKEKGVSHTFKLRKGPFGVTLLPPDELEKVRLPIGFSDSIRKSVISAKSASEK